MIRRLLLSFGLVALLLVIQSTWLDALAVYTVIPDLSLLAIVYLSFRNPGLEGQAVGFAAGLLQDGISAAPLGLHAFIKTAVAWIANMLSGKFYIDRVLMPALFGVVATLLKAVYLIVLAFFFPGKVLAYDLLGRLLWIEVAYNAVAAPILFLLMGPLDRFLLPRKLHG